MVYGGKSIVSYLVSLVWILSIISLLKGRKLKNKPFKKIWNEKEKIGDDIYFSFAEANKPIDFFLNFLPITFFFIFLVLSITKEGGVLIYFATSLLLSTIYYLKKRWKEKKSKFLLLEKVVLLITILVFETVLFYFFNKSVYLLLYGNYELKIVLTILNYNIYLQSLFIFISINVLYVIISIFYFLKSKYDDDEKNSIKIQIIFIEILVISGSIVGGLIFYALVNGMQLNEIEKTLLTIVLCLILIIVLYYLVIRALNNRYDNLPAKEKELVEYLFSTKIRFFSIALFFLKKHIEKNDAE